MAKRSPRLTAADRRELDAIEQLRRSRLPRAAFLRLLADRISRHVGADAFCLTVLDPLSGLPTEICSALDAEARRLWLDRVFQKTPLGDMGWLSQQPERVQTAEQFVPHPVHDPLVRNLLLPAGLGHMIALSLADAGQGWGYVNLMRRHCARNFAAEERNFLAALVPILTPELRRRATEQLLSSLPGAGVGVVTLDAGGAVEAMNDAAQTLLSCADRPSSFALAAAVVSHMLRRAIVDGAPPPIHAVPIVDASTGRRYRVRPELLKGQDGRFRGAVVIEPLRPLDDAGAKLQLGLTRREADVAALTIRGLSTYDTAMALGLSPHTVEHHLRNIFAKLEVGSRAEMTALLVGI